MEVLSAVDVPSSRVIPPTIRILHRAAWAAEKRIKLRVPFHMLWLVQDVAGRQEQFVTTCHAPDEVSDAQLLTALCDELRADFVANDITRFAVAFIGDLVDFVPGPLAAPPERQRREVVGIEAHNREGVHVGTHRQVIRVRGHPPVLGALSPLERLHRSRYLDLL
jgi:hypothetical protein